MKLRLLIPVFTLGLCTTLLTSCDDGPVDNVDNSQTDNGDENGVEETNNPWWWDTDPETMTPVIDGVHPNDIPWWWLNDPETSMPTVEVNTELVVEEGYLMYYSNAGFAYELSEISWLYEVVEHKVILHGAYSDTIYYDENGDGVFDFRDYSDDIVLSKFTTYTISEQITYVDLDGNELTTTIKTTDGFNPDTLCAFSGEELVFTLSDLSYASNTTSITYLINTDIINVTNLKINIYDHDTLFELYSVDGVSSEYGSNSVNIGYTLTRGSSYYYEFEFELEAIDGSTKTISVWNKYTYIT